LTEIQNNTTLFSLAPGKPLTAMREGFSPFPAIDLPPGEIAGGPFLRDLPGMDKEPAKISRPHISSLP